MPPSTDEQNSSKKAMKEQSKAHKMICNEDTTATQKQIMQRVVTVKRDKPNMGKLNLKVKEVSAVSSRANSPSEACDATNGDEEDFNKTACFSPQ